MARRHCRPTSPTTKWRGLHGHWPNVEVKLSNVLGVVLMLLWQHDTQLKIGIP